MMENGTWMSILEYASYRKISISTIRRYIKADQVKHRKLDGKYEIFVNELNLKKKEVKDERQFLQLKLENKKLEEKIKILTEENEDLRMLVNIYESNKVNKTNINPPEIPASN
ncbi:hypothetical protein OAT67_03690 [Bacteriovoracaceae bacterium]|nr:hypothetical protein [Bacteriovoracaceae bacterium]|tara:strand:- start:95067 stop:95405 length:339 start_codon:yes stop_codon:yes gene_type:complete